MSKELRLIKMSDVEVEEVMAHSISAEMQSSLRSRCASRAELSSPVCPLHPPAGFGTSKPISVIYQTAEDGLGDTIKPRLLAAGADCERVLVIDESETELTLSDARLEKAIRETGAKLIVLDPLQAYLGGDVDMHRANEIHPIFKRLCMIAEETGCAIILIGHMNKTQGAKSSYRGLGSIDFRAAARSVLVVGRLKDDPTIRIVAHDKSSLAPEGKSIAFALDPETGFEWKGYCETSVEELLAGKGSLQSKTTQAENLLQELLQDEPVATEIILQKAQELSISERTVKIAKQNLGVTSVKIGGKWFAKIPEDNSRG